MFRTKKKLMAAVVMLVISAIMMTSASYAWFTISTNPEISGMTTQVVVNENLEIALATDNETKPGDWEGTANDLDRQHTWGNIIDLTKTNFASDVASTLRPATINGDGTGFVAPKYGSDGRIDEMQVVSVTPIMNEDNVKVGYGKLVGATDNKVYGFYVDYWIRSNIDGKLKLLEQGKDPTSVNISGDYDFGSSIWVEVQYEEDDNETVKTAKQNKVKEQVAKLKKGLKIIFLEMAKESTGDSVEPISADFNTSTAANVLKVDGKEIINAKGIDICALTFTNNEITSLTAGEGKLIRMYVYYEGKNLSNNDAILGDELVNANLNIQFALVDNSGEVLVNTSMDKFD